jgi:hypothetical protein
MDFALSEYQKKLRQRCLELAADFASRAADHDRDASHPVENYDRLRAEGFLELTVGKEWGGAGASFLDHTIAYEALGQGCPSTALAFNMHASVVMPVLQSPEVSDTVKRLVADLVVREHRLIGQLRRTRHHIADRRTRAERAGVAHRRWLQHNRSKDVCLDAGGRRLRRGDGLSGRCH